MSIKKVNVNGTEHDITGVTDAGLSLTGVPADAKATGDAVRSQISDIKSDLIPIHNNVASTLNVTFTAVRQNIDTSFHVYAGMTYILEVTSDTAGKSFVFYTKGDSANVKDLYATGQQTFTSNIDGYLRFYNRSSDTGFVGTVTIMILPKIINDIANNVKNSLSGYNLMITTAERLSDITGGTKSCDDLPDNKIVCVGAYPIGLLDYPSQLTPSGVGTYFTIKHNYASTSKDGKVQFCIKNGVAVRQRWTGAWSDWWVLGKEDTVYYVGGSSGNSSLTSLLIDLKDDTSPKTIYINDGVYDIFEEYMEEVSNGRLQIPADDITASDYFYPYNAFVNNNTKLIGLGNVTLQMTPDADEITYGASRTWSPLNVLGNVEIENITVVGHNCRYCLHNDDHNNFPNSKQVYKNCRFLYTESDTYQNRKLGFNSVIGFGIQNGSTHVFKDCEMFIDTSRNDPAYYGHDGSQGKNGTLLLKNCIIHSSNYNNNKVIRLQTLATSQGKIDAIFENCYINGGMELQEYYADSPQNFNVTFNNCNKVPVLRTPATGGTIIDPYTVKWFNPLATPTQAEPLIETDSYID